VAWQVVSYLPNTLKVLVRVAAVCTSWRQAVLEADPVSGRVAARAPLLERWWAPLEATTAPARRSWGAPAPYRCAACHVHPTHAPLHSPSHPHTRRSVCVCVCVCVCVQVRLSTAEVRLNLTCPIRFQQSSQMHASGTLVPAVKRGRAERLPVPRLLQSAAAAGNVEGLIAIARMYEMRGNLVGAVSQWKAAAKAGSAQAQFRIGELFYQGNTDLGRDSEEALLWLQRAAKNPECSQEHLSVAATMLGYLHMDGDGCKVRAHHPPPAPRQALPFRRSALPPSMAHASDREGACVVPRAAHRGLDALC